MQVYAAPELSISADIPFDLNHAETDAAIERYRQALREWIRARLVEEGKRPHKLAGKSIFIPWADGAAEYMILDGRRMINVPLMDAWNVPDYMTRGLRVADLERMAGK